MAKPPFNVRLLIVSIGNPGDLFRTYHSAGHHGIISLQAAIYPPQPRFGNSLYGGEACKASVSDKYTLLQNPRFMNVSGPFVAQAWRQFHRERSGPGSHLGMIVVHDELERRFGDVALRNWDLSRKGHNGLKSIDAVLSARERLQANAEWKTCGVGIGRPETRVKSEVSNYVLSRMSAPEMDRLSSVGSDILAQLQGFEKSWQQRVA